MKKLYQILLAAFVSIFMFTATSAQEYLEMIDAGTFTVEEIQINAEAYFEIHGKDKGSGYIPFKRWEYSALKLMDENGRLKSLPYYIEELARFEAYLNESTEARSGGTNGDWVELGPTSWDAYQGWNPGVGRVTGFAVDASDNDHIIIGANTGGVWKTTDGGANWTPLTDYFSNLTVYSVTMHPTNSSTYFAGSSSGLIYTSTDSGSTWSLLGIAGGTSLINKILINPNDTTIMFATSQNRGIFRSTNSGASWVQIVAGETRAYDVEFKPGDPTVVYATGLGFYKSTNSGASFTEVTGLGNGPKMMGVTADDDARVYVLEADSGEFEGLYVSTNSGGSFTEINHAGRNYFGYDTDGFGSGGQAPRDMDIAVNPNDADEVHIAGVLTWRSLDAGVSFFCTSDWIPSLASGAGRGYCHADVDIMEFVGTTLYVGTDGGIFKATNTTVLNAVYYTDITFGLGIRQFYKIGITQSDPVIVTGGSQDNGSSVLTTSGVWRDWLGADGMEGFIDKNNNNIMYGTTQFGRLYRSSNGGVSYSGLSEPGAGFGNWVTPFEQDPNVANTIYLGYTNVYKSVNSGSSWTSISQNFGDELDNLKIAPTNSDIMYASRGSAMYKTTDGGATSWSTLSGYSGLINSIAIHPTDPDKVAIATTSSQRVYVSTDGGATWTSYKKNLPSFSALAVVWQDNTIDGLYVGMNYGLFYIDSTFTNWQVYNDNLPNVIVYELEINTVDDKIYAGTYGRGLWASPLYENPLSVAENELYQNLRMYPNPAFDEITIFWSEAYDVDVRIFNLSGKLLYKETAISLLNGHQVDISKLSAGVYFVRMNSELGTTVKKLIVK